MGSYIVRERGEPAVAAVRQAPVTEGEYQPGTTLPAEYFLSEATLTRSIA
jgi:hypothetical protein